MYFDNAYVSENRIVIKKDIQGTPLMNFKDIVQIRSRTKLFSLRNWLIEWGSELFPKLLLEELHFYKTFRRLKQKINLYIANLSYYNITW